MKNKKQKELPYRFTCPIPAINEGPVEIPERCKQVLKEYMEQKRKEHEKQNKRNKK